MNYDCEYFINKFEAIPKDNWLTIMNECSVLEGTCAMGFCGGYTHESDESKQLANLLISYYEIENICMQYNRESQYNLDAVIYCINDTKRIIDLPTPKERVLHALYTIRDKELSEANVKATMEIIKEDKALTCPQPEYA